MKKKIFVLVSTLVLVFAMTACSGGSANDGSSDSSSTKSEKSVVADEKELGSVIAEDGKSITITANNVDDDRTTELSETFLVVEDGQSIGFSCSIHWP